MGRLREAIHNIHYLDAAATQDKWLNHLHPLAKLLVTVVYILTVVSFWKYEFVGLLGMAVYPLVLFSIGKIPLKRSLHQLKPILLVVCAVGIANPLLDGSVIGHVGSIAITGGAVSMVTLMLKGILAVLASYLLIITTTIERICYALRLLHMPKGFVTVLLLIYRYMVVLLKEAERIMLAYGMRAPGQKGIHRKAWGPLLGQLLLRSMDRAQLVYDSMQLRGFTGEFPAAAPADTRIQSAIYAVVWSGMMVLWKIFSGS